jgi:hypothetical protein
MKCFQIMNFQNNWIWLLLTRENYPNTAVFHKKKSNVSKILFPYVVSIFVQNNKNQKQDRILKEILKSLIWFLLVLENSPYPVVAKLVCQSTILPTRNVCLYVFLLFYRYFKKRYQNIKSFVLCYFFFTFHRLLLLFSGKFLSFIF